MKYSDIKNTLILSNNLFYKTCLLLLVTCFSTSLYADSGVTARYLHSQGNELVIEILITSPPPSSLILMQKLPPGVIITNSHPSAQNVNTEKGEAKWLLRNLKPGTLSVRMSLDQTVLSNEISGEIRYKTPQDGSMKNQAVTKP